MGVIKHLVKLVRNPEVLRNVLLDNRYLEGVRVAENDHIVLKE